MGRYYYIPQARAAGFGLLCSNSGAGGTSAKPFPLVLPVVAVMAFSLSWAVSAEIRLVYRDQFPASSSRVVLHRSVCRGMNVADRELICRPMPVLCRLEG